MIELRAVTKRHANGVVAVDSLTMEIATGELCILVGPSGCGKTTTLKMINRLVEPTSGEIFIDDVDVLSLDAVELRRGIGYVSQQGGLFPHRRVADNVATIPRLLGWSTERVAARVDELLDLVGLDPADYRRRYPHELSGGERQRVGVARALGADPPVLLMDEPFGAVDPIARKRLQAEFRELQARVNKTVVFVTHDIEEALILGDRIAIMQRGAHLEQYDTPPVILAKPATSFVAQFVGVDRDLERLGFATLGLEDVLATPQVATGTTVAAAKDAAAIVGAQYLVIVDGERASDLDGDHDDSDHDATPLGYLRVTELESLDGALGRVAHPFAAMVALGASLRTVLAATLLDDDPVIAVTSEERFVGVLSLEAVHMAMRRSTASMPPGE